MASSTCSRLCTTNDELDAGIIFGTGFAPFRGGPIQYIRSAGVEQTKARLKELAKKHGSRFAPKSGWDLL
jgi:3-hydroxyacyl-CoA dehydrogenase/enoyl-CoA hydratase/3-hydroxybutyryl-CoA epimerase